MGGILSRSLVVLGGVGLLVVACGEKGASLPPRGDGNATSTSQALFANEQVYRGQNLGDRELILTFDDGPSSNDTADGHYQTRAISSYLKSLGIKTTFFIIGGCVQTVTDANLKKYVDNGCSDPSANAIDTIKAVIADGHSIANHTTTHRVQSGLAFSDSENDMKYTDTILKPYIAWNRFFFRTPTGDWNDDFSTATKYNAPNEPMNKYWGPIYWTIGGGPTTYGNDTSMAADWECWGGQNNSGTNRLTTTECATRYLNEIHAFRKGIVLMHDQAYGNADAATDDVRPGNTLRMIKRILPQLIDEGYTFKTLDQDPDLARVLPKCDATCGTCTGATSSDCSACNAGRYLSGTTCAACATCSAGTYQTAACTTTANTVCATCATCSAGTYQTAACTATANTVCAACATCGAGTFRSGACTATANTTCATCTTCGAGTFAAAACTATSDTACNACSTCPAGQHATHACTATADTVCANDDGTPMPDAGPGEPDGDGGPTDPATPTTTEDGGATGPADGSSADTPSPSGGGCAAAPSSPGSSLASLGLAGVGLLLARRRRSRAVQRGRNLPSSR